MTYKANMLVEFNKRFMAAKSAYDALTDKALAATETPKAVKIRTELAKEFWSQEDEETRARYAADAEEEYGRDIEEWEAAQLIPKTPLQYHQCVLRL